MVCKYVLNTYKPILCYNPILIQIQYFVINSVYLNMLNFIYLPYESKRLKKLVDYYRLNISKLIVNRNSVFIK